MPIRYMPIVPSSGYMTANQEAGMDANTKISAADPVASRSDIPTQLVEKPANQAAATYSAFTNAKSKYFLDYYPIVELAAGPVAIDLANIYTPITIKGDTRPLAGLTYMHGTTEWSNQTNSGSGSTTLSSSGNDITITCSGANPNLTGWGTGDKVWIVDTTGNAAEYTISSVSGNTITLTTAAPTVNGLGASITLIPNRTINESLLITENLNVTLQGFAITPSLSPLEFVIQGKCTLKNCAFYNNTDTWGYILVKGHGHLIIEDSSTVNTYRSIYIIEQGFADLLNFTANKCTTSGIQSNGGHLSSICSKAAFCTYSAWVGYAHGKSELSYCAGLKSATGFNAGQHGFLSADHCTAQYNTTGYYSSEGAFITAPNTNANNSGNGTNYNAVAGEFAICTYS